MTKELIEHGHEFDASWITRPLMADETVESVLSSHSERIALAVNFMQNPVPSEIQITKNLRICGDCRKSLSHLLKSIFCFYSRRGNKIVQSNSTMRDYCP